MSNGSWQRFVRRVRYGRSVVVVSGLPRSGTSMAMKMLEAGGLEIVTDGQREADEDNPRGYFEDDRVLKLHEKTDTAWLRDARGKAVKIISFLLPYLPEANNYKVLLMDRHIEEVLASQRKMLDRRGETSDTSDADMQVSYEQNVERVQFVVRRRPCFEALDVPHRSVLENPREQAARMQAFLDLPLDVDRMAGVVDNSLYRNRR